MFLKWFMNLNIFMYIYIILVYRFILRKGNDTFPDPNNFLKNTTSTEIRSKNKEINEESEFTEPERFQLRFLATYDLKRDCFLDLSLLESSMAVPVEEAIAALSTFSLEVMLDQFQKLSFACFINGYLIFDALLIDFVRLVSIVQL